jgi:hypothetical protein
LSKGKRRKPGRVEYSETKTATTRGVRMSEERWREEQRWRERDVRAMSEEEVRGAFDRLVGVWDAHQALSRELERFDHERPLPEPPPAGFESVEDLYEYDRRRWDYEQERERLQRAVESSRESYEAAAELAILLLPSYRTLVHVYEGKSYAITNEGQQVDVRPREK